jgi:hypothetical protein
MLAYAITLALVETSLARPLERPTRRTRGAIGAFALSCLIVTLLAVAELISPSHKAQARSLPGPIAPPAAGGEPLLHSVRLPEMPTGRAWLVSDAGRSGSPTAMILFASGGRLKVLVEPMDSAGRRVIAAGARPGGSILGGTVGNWRGVRSLFVVSQFGSTVSEEAVALDGTGRVLANGRAQLGPEAAGTERYAAINLDSSGRPALFLVERTGDHLRITVRPGFPVPGRPETSIYGRLPFSMQPRWTPVIASVDSAGADVALLSTARDRVDGSMQMKVIAANTGYRTFGTQGTVPIRLPVSPLALAIVHDRGAPVLLVLDRRTRTLFAAGLWRIAHRSPSG